GHSATVTPTVTVTDNQLPTSACPGAGTKAADAGQRYATGLVLGSPITGDNCGVASVTNDAPAQFPVGTTTVHWTVIDTSGHSNTCSQTVTVGDNQPPTITCPANVTTNANLGGCTITNVALGAPVTSDNCSVASLTNDAPTVYFIGTTGVVWTVTDVHGNSASCTQTVTIAANPLAC